MASYLDEKYIPDNMFPCPFCGGKGIILKDADNYYYPTCENKYNCVSGQLEDYVDGGVPVNFETIEESINYWNTRINEKPLSISTKKKIIQEFIEILYKKSPEDSRLTICLDDGANALDNLNNSKGSYIRDTLSELLTYVYDREN